MRTIYKGIYHSPVIHFRVTTTGIQGEDIYEGFIGDAIDETMADNLAIRFTIPCDNQVSINPPNSETESFALTETSVDGMTEYRTIDEAIVNNLRIMSMTPRDNRVSVDIILEGSNDHRNENESFTLTETSVDGMTHRTFEGKYFPPAWNIRVTADTEINEGQVWDELNEAIAQLLGVSFDVLEISGVPGRQGKVRIDFLKTENSSSENNVLRKAVETFRVKRKEITKRVFEAVHTPEIKIQVTSNCKDEEIYDDKIAEMISNEIFAHLNDSPLTWNKDGQYIVIEVRNIRDNSLSVLETLHQVDED